MTTVDHNFFYIQPLIVLLGHVLSVDGRPNPAYKCGNICGNKKFAVARPIEKLTALQVQRYAKKPGMYGDGGGLRLCVSSAHASSWLFRYQLASRAREMGLGPYPAVSLAHARELAAAARKQKAMGIDPLEERAAKAAEKRAQAARAITFRQCAEAYIKAHRAGWKNEKHASQWPATLATYVYPIIGDVAAKDVDVGMIHKILEPIWTTKSETASRVRGRIEAILDWAKVRGYRDGENPARWRGHLENLFPARSKVRRVEHHAALPYADIPDFMASLAMMPGMAALALRFTIWGGPHWLDRIWTDLRESRAG